MAAGQSGLPQWKTSWAKRSDQLISRANQTINADQPQPAPGRAVVPYTLLTDMIPLASPILPGAGNDDAGSLSGLFPGRRIDVRWISPSDMAEISLDLYAMGLVTFEDYSALAYHAELHPEYDRTIGALTGQSAAPERRRDLIVEWTDKKTFLQKHCPGNRELINQSERIVSLLCMLDHHLSA